MNLNLAWTVPSPIPSCGYRAQYRRKGDPSYTEVDTSGTTSTIQISAPASYEGNIISDCCGVNNSTGTPFGVNGYSTITVTANVSSGGVLTLTITSLYANSYDNIVSGSFTVNGTTPVTFSRTYSAGNVTQTYTLGSGYPASAGITAMVVTTPSPIFDKGGQLQQYDMVNTPPYFQFYWSGNISGGTWDGSPISLPSFTLDSFTITETSPDGLTILAGTLDVSYILHTLPSSSFTTLSLEVFDPVGSVLIGSAIILTSPLGIRRTSITLTKSTSILTSATQFTMKAVWPDLSVIDSRVFYLP